MSCIHSAMAFLRVGRACWLAGVIALVPGVWSATPEKGPAAETQTTELPATGKNLPRDKGGWINVEATGQRLILRFFDTDKKPIAPDMLRGQALFRYGGKTDARVPLNVEGMTLATPATVHPPHNYVVFLYFFTDEGGQPSETLSFHYP